MVGVITRGRSIRGASTPATCRLAATNRDPPPARSPQPALAYPKQPAAPRRVQVDPAGPAGDHVAADPVGTSNGHDVVATSRPLRTSLRPQPRELSAAAFTFGGDGELVEQDNCLKARRRDETMEQVAVDAELVAVVVNQDEVEVVGAPLAPQGSAGQRPSRLPPKSVTERGPPRLALQSVTERRALLRSPSRLAQIAMGGLLKQPKPAAGRAVRQLVGQRVVRDSGCVPSIGAERTTRVRCATRWKNSKPAERAA